MSVRRASHVAGAVFAAAALTVLVLNLASPFERGWWLAAYLFLVGCCSQVLLVAGRRATMAPASALALWTLGTVTVAVADMAGWLAGVAVGSVILLTALALFMSGARPLNGRYLTLLIFLAGSVVVGTVLAAVG